VRLGHVIRYIGRGKGGGEGTAQARRHLRSKAPTQFNCATSQQSQTDRPHSGKVSMYPAGGRPPGDHSWLFCALELAYGRAEARASIRRYVPPATSGSLKHRNAALLTATVTAALGAAVRLGLRPVVLVRCSPGTGQCGGPDLLLSVRGDRTDHSGRRTLCPRQAHPGCSTRAFAAPNRRVIESQSVRLSASSPRPCQVPVPGRQRSSGS
jgi:hypothetical protein